ncbi:NmrA family NAD(P)-binding protein [Companilactobacillus sp. HBUAS56275]|uniref:NmrA family NAD(P)-binding protein n=1 Tax=Candidatus Companilactobacillus pullicola TaxID=2838523 RepID=A0A9D2CPG2_9LACO|nr:NmrA family NAD(P)-binding protein [Candidatus Companilactobacillus pullicola]
MEKILVIGGNGNIGFPLIKYLCATQKVEVVAGVHNLAKDLPKFDGLPNLEIEHFDFLDSSTFPKAFDGVSKVFFVRPPQLANPKVDMLPFLKYAQTQQIEQVVFVSLLGVEKNPRTPHHQIENMIEELNLPYTFIRPSFFMQNLNTTHCEDIVKNHDLFIPAGRSRTSFIDTRDIAEVAGIVLLNDKYLHQKLNITGPAALNYYEIAEVMTKVLGTKITYSKPSLLKFRKTMLQRGLPKNFVNVMVMLYLITQLGNAKTVTNETAKILGHAPRTITNYVKDYQDYFVQ